VVLFIFLARFWAAVPKIGAKTMALKHEERPMASKRETRIYTRKRSLRYYLDLREYADVLRGAPRPRVRVTFECNQLTVVVHASGIWQARLGQFTKFGQWLDDDGTLRLFEDPLETALLAAVAGLRGSVDRAGDASRQLRRPDGAKGFRGSVVVGIDGVRQIVDSHASLEVHLQHRVREIWRIGENASCAQSEIEQADLIVTRSVRKDDCSGMKAGLLEHRLEVAPVVRHKREFTFEQLSPEEGVLTRLPSAVNDVVRLEPVLVGDVYQHGREAFVDEQTQWHAAWLR
jgi:hypothetical protein